MYEYDNQSFSSLKKLAAYVGLNEKTLTARLRRGMPIEEACNPTLFGRVYVGENRTDNISALSKERKIDSYLIYNRRRYGYSTEEAFNTPKKITRQGKPIVVKGVLYASIAKAARELNLEDKEQRIRRRLKNGIEPDKAFY